MKQPLFGQDSSPHITSMLISAIATLICWIIFCVLCFVVKFKPAVPEYKEIQIVLSSTPTEQKVAEEMSTVQESAAAVAENASAVVEPVETTAPELPKPVETPVAQAKVEAPKETPADKKVSYELVKSVEEQMAEQMSAKKTTTVPDWWNDDTSVTEQQTDVSPFPQKVTAQSGMSGESASRSDISPQGAKSSPKNNNTSNSSPSEATTGKLSSIKNATPYSKQTGSVESTVMAETTKSNGYVNMKMSDGSTRALIEPMTPVITLSPEAAKAVGNTVTVRIKFYVSKVGNVKSEISILYQNNDNSAESLLPSIVRNEIYDQLKKWVFEPGTSEAFAIFEFTIKKQ